MSLLEKTQDTNIGTISNNIEEECENEERPNGYDGQDQSNNNGYGNRKNQETQEQIQSSNRQENEEIMSKTIDNKQEEQTGENQENQQIDITLQNVVRKERQKKLRQFDSSEKIAIYFSQEINDLQNFEQKINLIKEMFKDAGKKRNEIIQKELKREIFYENEFGKFIKRRFTKNIKTIKLNKFNLLIKKLWIYKKETHNIKKLLIEQYVEKKIKQLDLLDLSKTQNQNIQESLKFIKENINLKKSLDYFSKIKYQKFDFIELALILSKIVSSYQFLDLNDRITIDPIYKVLIKICNIKVEKKFSKLQINFTCKNILNLSKSAKNEIIEVIQMGKEDSSFWLDQNQQDQSVLDQITKMMDELQKSLNQLN